MKRRDLFLIDCIVAEVECLSDSSMIGSPAFSEGDSNRFIRLEYDTIIGVADSQSEALLDLRRMILDWMEGRRKIGMACHLMWRFEDKIRTETNGDEWTARTRLAFAE